MSARTLRRLKLVVPAAERRASADDAQRLVAEAVQADGRDNTTALVFEMS